MIISPLFREVIYMASLKEFWEVIKKVATITAKIEEMEQNLTNRIDSVDERLDSINKRLTPLEKGLQLELFSSLSTLLERTEKKHYATTVEKQDAQRIYNQIHALGQDGFSDECYHKILQMPESKEEYWIQTSKHSN